MYVFFDNRWKSVKESKMIFGKNSKFDSQPVCNERCLKTKINSHNGKMNKHFQNNKIPK